MTYNTTIHFLGCVLWKIQTEYREKHEKAACDKHKSLLSFWGKLFILALIAGGNAITLSQVTLFMLRLELIHIS